MTAPTVHEQVLTSEKAISFVINMAEGNGITRSQVVISDTNKCLRPVEFTLTASPEYETQSNTRYGYVELINSSQMQNAGAARAKYATLCKESLDKLATEKYVPALFQKAPNQQFKSMLDRTPITCNPVSVHWYEQCSNCNRGRIDCTNYVASFRAGSHTERCTGCGGDGKRTCYKCNSSGRVSVQRSYQDNTGAWRTENTTANCGECGGRGRVDNYCCNGRGYIPCRSCHGSGTLKCGACNGTSGFTYSLFATFILRVKKTVLVPTSYPARFRASVEKVKLLTLFDESVMRETVTAVVGSNTVVRIKADVPHLAFSVTLKKKIFAFDAVGKSQTIPIMPAFLDDLLSSDRIQIWIETDRKNFVKAIEVAGRTVIHNAILDKIVANSLDLVAFSASTKGAVTEVSVQDVAANLTKAYHGLGKPVVRSVWIASYPIIVAAGALPVTLGIDRWGFPLFTGPDFSVPSSSIIMCLLALVVLCPLLATICCAYATASFRSRRAVGRLTGRRNVGLNVKQGWLPALGLLVGMGACTAAAYARTESCALDRFMGIPSAYEARLLHAIQTQNLDDWSNTAFAATLTSADYLPASGLPRWQPSLAPGNADIHGNPGTFKVEYLLGELGFWSGPPDGIPSDKFRNAAGSFLSAVRFDDLTPYRGQSLSGLLDAALEDKIDSDWGMDNSIFGPLPNAVRGRLSISDIDAVSAAIDRGNAAKGKIVDWNGAEPGIKGRILVSPYPRFPAGSILVDVSVDIDGQEASTGPMRAFKFENIWTAHF